MATLKQSSSDSWDYTPSAAKAVGDVVILGNAERELPDLIPADVGLVLLSVDQPNGKQSGIYEDHELLGRIAVEHLVAKLNQNILGPLPQARVHLVEGSWVAGKTAPGAGRRRS